MCPEAAQASQPNTQPLWFAGLVAAVSAPFAYWVVLVVIEVAIRGSFLDEETMRALGLLAMVGVPACLIVMFVFGYPLVLLLRKQGRLSALNLCAGGAFIGAATAVLIAKILMPSNPVDVALPLLGAATGLFAGIVFCLVARIPFRRSRP